MKKLDPAALKHSLVYDEYLKVAPKPEQFDQVCAKLSAMTEAFEEVPISEVKALRMPAMFIYGDADMVKPEHAAALFRAAGGGVFGDMAPLRLLDLRSCQEPLILASFRDPNGSRKW